MRMLRRKVGDALGRWRDVAGVLGEERRRVAGVVVRMRYRGMSARWNRWRELAGEERRCLGLVRL